MKKVFSIIVLMIILGFWSWILKLQQITKFEKAEAMHAHCVHVQFVHISRERERDRNFASVM